MCKAASPPPPPTTEVADEIKNTTSVDNSWSFINIHLPSAVTTTIVIIIFLIATWTLLRLYSRFSKARQPTDQTRPGQPPATSPPATWPSAPPRSFLAFDNSTTDIDIIDIGYGHSHQSPETRLNPCSPSLRTSTKSCPSFLKQVTWHTRRTLIP